jgi:Fe-S-cluster containining protein
MPLTNGDAQLIQIVDAAVADAARRSGSWLKCAPGCTQCCIGVFPISQLDATRLHEGLLSLDSADPPRAAAVRARAHQAIARLAPDFPGDPSTGILDEDRAADFENFANEEPCPALDPATGLCDLYAARPMTCRTFGPPLRMDASDQDSDSAALGVCELCFQGASSEDIAACEVHLETAAVLESSLTEEAEQTTGLTGNTIIAFALARQLRCSDPSDF